MTEQLWPKTSGDQGVFISGVVQAINPADTGKSLSSACFACFTAHGLHLVS
jgi:hypothetical protein